MQSKLQDGSIIVCGYVARDAELKTTQTGKSLCRWSVKAGERQNGEEKEAIWVNCKAWHDAARAASQIKKGDTVLAVGRLDISEYEGETYKNLVCEFVSIMRGTPAESVATSNGFEDLSEFEALGDDVPF